MNIQLLTNFRTGSNRLIKLLEQNFKDMTCLYEPFSNMEFHNYDEYKTTWVLENNKVILKQLSKSHFVNQVQLLNYKIQIIKDTLNDNSYVWKSQPNEWINETVKQEILSFPSKVITRINVLEQIASYQFARLKGNWIKPIFNTDEFKIEMYAIQDIINNKKQLDNLSLEKYYYEDMPDNPNECIEWLGFERNFEIKEYQEKINHNILNQVVNIKEVEILIRDML